LLPRGLLREPRTSLGRADAIIITRADQCAPEVKQRLIAEIRQLGRDEAPIETVFRPTGLVDAEGNRGEIGSLGAVAAFCGIGNPDGFRQSLTGAGVRLVTAVRAFPDHHHYTDTDLADLATWAREQRVAALVTTQKDLVKIPRRQLGELSLWALTICAEFVAGQDRLFQRFQDLATRISAPNLSKFQ
jgi:tetraacyldisaccharide 4'-kinase